MELLRSYQKRKRGKDGSRRIKYDYATGHTKGRLSSVGGVTMQDIDRPLRHAFVGGILRDLDVVNAHPTMYSQLLRKMNRAAPFLNEYVANCKKHRHGLAAHEGITYEEAKLVLLRITYGGGAVHGRMNVVTYPFALDLLREMRSHHEFLALHFPTTFQLCKDMGKSYPESSCASMILGSVENGILKVMYDVAEGLKMVPSVLAYDGLMCRMLHPRFFEIAEREITAKTGYSVRLEEKMIPPYDLEAMRAKYCTAPPEEEYDGDSERVAGGTRTATAPPANERESKRQRMDVWAQDKQYLDSVCVGNKEIAIELARMRGDVLKNVAGDNQAAVFYRFNEKTTLWEMIYGADVMVEELETVHRSIQGMLDRHADYKAELSKQARKCKERGTYFRGQEDLNTFEKATKCARSLSYFSTLSAILRLACNTLRDPEFTKLLDNNPEILSVKNGVIDLRTGMLRDRRKEDYLSFAIDVTYDPDHPEVGNIESFIDDITLSTRLNRPEYAPFLQALLGYAITGYDREQILCFCLGSGANGKGVCSAMMRRILGDFYYAAPADVIRASKHTTSGAALSHIVKLKHKRTAWVDEMPEGRVDRQLLAALCGGAPISARDLHCKLETFVPTHTLFCNSNFMPGMPNDIAVLRRVIALPFDAEFRTPGHHEPQLRYDPENPLHFIRDNDFVNSLSAEAFLTWVVEGARLYLAAGALPPRPECCAAKSDEVKAENDKLQCFIEEMCVVRLDASETCADFLTDYRRWRSYAGLPKKEVYTELYAKGFKRGKCKSGAYRDKEVIFGLALSRKYDNLFPWDCPDCKWCAPAKCDKCIALAEQEAEQDAALAAEQQVMEQALRRIAS